MKHLMNLFVKLAVPTTQDPEVNGFLKNLNNLVFNYIIPILFWGATVIFIILAILFGVRWVQAQSADEKANNKKYLQGFFVGILICGAAPVLIPIVFNLVTGMFN